MIITELANQAIENDSVDVVFLILGSLTLIGFVSLFFPSKPSKCSKDMGVCVCSNDEDRLNCEVFK